MPGFRLKNPRAAVCAAAAFLSLAAFGTTLTQRAYVNDDAWIIGSSSLLDAGIKGLPTLMTTGYWESVDGSAARVHEYRPLLMLSYLAQRLTTGRAAPPMHAANLLLHMLACWLVFAVFRRRLSPAAAAAGTLAFAVMPTHAEAVAALTGRSELLAAVLLLGAWLCLDESSSMPRLAAGTALFSAALFTKEHSLLFPLFLALADWTFAGAAPWSPGRRRVHAALLAAVAGYLIVRLALLKLPFGGGAPYFPDRLTAALTVSRFALLHYLWPSLSGFGLCTDYARPLIADAAPGAWLSWLPLLALAGLFAAGFWRLLARRAAWGFWLCGPVLFLLPTAHIVVPLDTIGAQRFLYLPSLGLAAGLGAAWAWLYAARPRAAGAAAIVLLAWQTGQCAAISAAWRSGISYYEAAISCNPVSARARAAYGTQLIVDGRAAAGQAQLAEAVRLAPNLGLSYYNLARYAWERGDTASTGRLIRDALARDAGSGDAWILASLVAHAQGRDGDEENFLRRALALTPWNPIANLNLARFELAHGRPGESIAHWRAFARYAPEDPDAPRAEEIARELQSR